MELLKDEDMAYKGKYKGKQIDDLLDKVAGSSSGGGAYAEVNHGTSDTTFTLTPNTFHVWDEVASLDLSLADETTGVANEYLFQFTSGATPTALTLPDSIKWANDTPPSIVENMIYQISILNGLAVCLEFRNVSLGSFTVSSHQTWTYYFELGMTWEEWVNSEYNTFGYTVSNNRVWQSSTNYVTNVSPSDSIDNGNSYGLTYYD